MPDFPPAHPGDVLREDVMRPLGLTATALARALGVPGARLSGMLRARRAVTPDTALRLARDFGTSAEFWLSLQALHDLALAREAVGAEVEATVHPRAAATPATA